MTKKIDLEKEMIINHNTHQDRIGHYARMRCELIIDGKVEFSFDNIFDLYDKIDWILDNYIYDTWRSKEYKDWRKSTQKEYLVLIDGRLKKRRNKKKGVDK